MKYSEIFEAYYALYRAEADTPTSADDEYVVGVPLANEAINRWANYDNTMWKTLFTTLQESGDGNSTVSTSTDYTCPDDMQEVGGKVQILDGDTVIRSYQVVDPQEAQFLTDTAFYAYFTGDPANGFTMHLNPAPDTAIVGKSIDYVYYKKPTLFSATTDTAETEMPQPYFIVHRMLANRFRASRNPYYASAKTDAEDVLRTMQLANNSGSWDNPWKVVDRSGSQWGG